MPKGFQGFQKGHKINIGRICSIETRMKTAGDKNPAKRQEVRDKISKALTGKKYPEIRVRDNFTCQICKVPELEFNRRLDIHHKDYNKKNNTEINLVALCQSCHLKTNFNREYWLNYFVPERQKVY